MKRAAVIYVEILSSLQPSIYFAPCASLSNLVRKEKMLWRQQEKKQFSFDPPENKEKRKKENMNDALKKFLIAHWAGTSTYWGLWTH